MFPPAHGLPPWKAYGFAVLSSLVAGALTWAVSARLESLSFFEFFHAAVVLSAFIGGLGPGILSAALSFLILDYFIIAPAWTFILGPHLLRLLLFAVVAVLTALLSERLRAANRVLRLSQEELQKDLRWEASQRREAETALLEVTAREQQRLGQDLHDGLCQTLAGLRLMMGRLHQDPPPAAALAAVENELGAALEQAYAASRGLYPVELEAQGLMSALKDMTAKIARLHGIRCRFRCPQPVAVQDNAVATHIFRIAQEAVTNAVKNGKAKDILVRLSMGAGGALLAVTDNGGGFGEAPPRPGMGLRIMGYRARVLGAELRLRTRRRGGAVIACRTPMSPSSGGTP